ncbi:Membrane-bound transcription factor site-2 protease [Bagarius yarrelli]|uniref:Membrane-bound transcription factor site-2 protease n=1 Tax=Bagarius yarrelli TaxID=175774 RepID=A0A556VVL5_BAGYA|nr:Membrane-bound transcription factor site-2 protease [Bagarius yarrelli]
MFGSVLLLSRTLLQTLAQMLAETPDGSHEQVLQVVGSPSSGPHGLFVGDLLTALDDCELSGVNDWHSCIQQLSLRPQRGYCAHQHALQLNRASAIGREFRRLDGTTECCSNTTV